MKKMDPREAEKAYAVLSARLHLLFLTGGADSPEHDRLCDEMDLPWYSMDEDGLRRTRERGILYSRIEEGLVP